MSKALTVKSIDAVKPKNHRVEISDGAMPGLFFIVQPSGSKSWAFRYRSPEDRKPRKLTIGRYPVLGLADARNAAREAARSVTFGTDPGDHKKQTRFRAADSSDQMDIVLGQFVLRHVEKRNKATTAREAKRLIRTIVEPAWGKRKITSITRNDVTLLLDNIVDRGTAITANRVLALVRKFFNWCVDRGVITQSPVAGVKAPAAERTRDRFLTNEEISSLWRATEHPTPFNLSVRMMLLTGQRRGEVVGMRWSELDFELEEPVWNLPASRTKNSRAHTVPISSLVQQVVLQVPRIESSDLVFTTNGRTVFSGWSKAKWELDNRMLVFAGQPHVERSPLKIIPNWRLHDLRRTAASGMAKLGHPVHVVEAVLNHKSGTVSGVAAVYNRYDYSAEKRRALEEWGVELNRLALHRHTAPNRENH